MFIKVVCKVSHKQYFKPYSVTGIIIVISSSVLPYITPFEFEGEVNTGDSVQLNCYVGKGDTPLNISWLLNGKEIENIFGITTISIGSRTNLLTITSVQPEHAGLYACEASNKGGEGAHTAELLINGIVHFVTYFLFNYI